ncbi:MAG: hypothetical protein RPU62_10160 [Candidatus Sedimenticola sp. (ex Thyasira tokunagai)]
MNRYITAEAQTDIIQYLVEWQTGKYGRKLTWSHVSKAFGYSRQALSGNAEIKGAYDDAKEKLRNARSEVDELSSIASENKKLKARVNELERLNSEYEQKYVRWQINSMELGVTEDQLNKPVAKSLKEHLRKNQ